MCVRLHKNIDKERKLDKLNKMKSMKIMSLVDKIHIIMKWRKFILYETLIVILVTLVVSLIIPNQYTSKATILPPNPERDAMLGILFSSFPSGLSGITGASGLLGGPTTSDLYANIMKSHVILDKIIAKYQLKEVFKTKTMDDTYKALLSITEVIVTPEGIISVSVIYKNKILAANIANSFVEELDRFNTETAMTVGKKYRIFIEQRLAETIDTLAKTENALRLFQEKHRTVALDAEIQSAIQTIAQLKSEIILREVQKGAASSISSLNNPYVTNINQELSQLKRQLSIIEFGSNDTTNREFGAGFSMPFARLPELSMEYARLLRDVKVQEAIYELMTQQYEQAKVMELKDTPTVQFLDRAVPAEKKSHPRRSILLITVGFISLLVGVCFAFILEYCEKIRKNQSADYDKWKSIFDTIKHDIISLKGFFMGIKNKLLRRSKTTNT